MLSAQSTDKQVNKVTPAVFRDFPTVEAMAAITPDILYPYVRLRLCVQSRQHRDGEPENHGGIRR